MGFPHRLFLPVLAGTLAAGAAVAQVGTPGFPAGPDAGRVLPWLAANTSVKRADIVDIGPQAVVSLDSVTAFPGKTASALVVVREEITDQGYADRRRARSARIEVELDCTAAAYRVRRLSRYALPDLQGVEMEGSAPQVWAHAAEGAPMSRILHIACARAAALQTPPAPARPERKAVIAAAPAPISVSSAPPPTADLTHAIAIAAVQPLALPAAAVEAPAAQPASPQPTSPQAPPQPAPPAPPPTAQTAAAPMPFKVQLGSYSTPQNAHRAGALLRRDFPKPVLDHDIVVDQASSRGKDYYLLLVQGFAQPTDAAAFCKAIAAAPGECRIRRQ